MNNPLGGTSDLADYYNNYDYTYLKPPIDITKNK
jgi:hypothetical protein